MPSFATMNIESKEGAQESDVLQVVGFLVEQEEYAIAILDITSVERLYNVRHFPHMPLFVEGVMRIQDEIVPLVRLRHKLGFPLREHTDRSRVVVVEHGDDLIGFIVEAVTGVKRVSPCDLELAPKLALSTETRFVKGVFRAKDEMVVLLDVHRILTPEEISTVGEISQIAEANRRELQ